jgi:hypothetical protein
MTSRSRSRAVSHVLLRSECDRMYQQLGGVRDPCLGKAEQRQEQKERVCPKLQLELQVQSYAHQETTLLRHTYLKLRHNRGRMLWVGASVNM